VWEAVYRSLCRGGTGPDFWFRLGDLLSLASLGKGGLCAHPQTLVLSVDGHWPLLARTLLSDSVGGDVHGAGHPRIFTHLGHLYILSVWSVDLLCGVVGLVS
jgi:hypothetical protein